MNTTEKHPLQTFHDALLNANDVVWSQFLELWQKTKQKAPVFADCVLLNEQVLFLAVDNGTAYTHGLNLNADLVTIYHNRDVSNRSFSVLPLLALSQICLLLATDQYRFVSGKELYEEIDKRNGHV